MTNTIFSNINKYFLAFLCGVLMLLFFLVLNHEIYLPVGKNLCDFSSDGIKNLYTFAYYLKYDEGLTFTGLFYPYTEQVVYMDAQPFWVWIIKAVEYVFHFHIDNPIVYIHLILLFNIWLCGFFIFLILFHYCNDYYFSILGTFIIVLLSPQIFRFSSHYALGNMGIIPMFWWWYICMSKHNKILSHILFSIALVLIGYIHPYLLLMLLFLFLSYEIIGGIITRKIAWVKIISILSSLVLFQSSIKIFDTVKDRPVNAWGAKEFACKLYDILLPLAGGIKDEFVKLIPKINTGYTEGHGYVSIFGIFVLLFLIIRFFSSIIRKKWKPNITQHSTAHWLLASVPVLLFAFFIPFRWHMDWLINLITPLKQFRGTGRFVAVFFYVYLVFVFAYLKNLHDKYPKVMSVVLFTGFIISFYDIINNNNVVVDSYRKYGKPDAYNYFKNRSEELFAKIDNVKDYQCIIPYPASTEGTEVMWLEADWNAKIHYFWLSYFYQLPLATVHSSRASFSNSIDLVQLSGFYSSSKPILNKFDASKKCLVIAETSHQYDSVPLLRNATWLNTFDNLAIYSIDINSLKNNYTNSRVCDWIDTSKYTFLGKNTFNESKNGTLLLNNKKVQHNVLTVQVPDNKKDKKLRILFWYTPRHTANSDVPIMSAYNVKNKQEIFIHDWRERHTQTYNYRDEWFCVDYTQAINNETTTIKLKLSSKDILADDVSVYLER